MEERNKFADRLIFVKGQQRKFLLEARKQLGCSNWTAMSESFDFHRRSLSDWAKEKWRISEEAAQAIAAKSGVAIPATVKSLKWEDHARQAGKIGNVAIQKKYGGPLRTLIDEQYRQSQWQKWWDQKGQYLPSSIDNAPVPIKIPKHSPQLAEFIGIVLGDGGISKYQIKITLHSIDDKQYMLYVKQLIEGLFGVPCKIQRHNGYNANDLVISRIELVRYCLEEHSLVVGNKVRQQVGIPEWIKSNRAYMQACARGLFDTDGSVYTHSYRVNGKQYSYKKMSYSSRSLPLLHSFTDLMIDLGLKPAIRYNRDVRLEDTNDVAKYFRVIGTHNPKHLKRYRS